MGTSYDLLFRLILFFVDVLLEDVVFANFASQDCKMWLMESDCRNVSGSRDGCR